MNRWIVNRWTVFINLFINKIFLIFINVPLNIFILELNEGKVHINLSRSQLLFLLSAK